MVADLANSSTDVRFMIDHATYHKMHSSALAFNFIRPKATHSFDNMPAALSYDQEPTRVALLLLQPVIHGFYLHKKKWTHLFVDCIHSITWNKIASERLVATCPNERSYPSTGDGSKIPKGYQTRDWKHRQTLRHHRRQGQWLDHASARKGLFGGFLVSWKVKFVRSLLRVKVILYEIVYLAKLLGLEYQPNMSAAWFATSMVSDDE
jgi:hypothetical protein